MGAKTAVLKYYLIHLLTTSFRPLAIFWISCVLLMSLYQVLNPTSAHNIGVHVDPLAALMQQLAFQVSVLFPNLGKVVLSILYTVLQSLGIVVIFICLSLIYIPLRFLIWIGSVLWYDFIFAKIPPTTINHDKDEEKDELKQTPGPGGWFDTPESSPLEVEFQHNSDQSDDEKTTPTTPSISPHEKFPSTPKSRQTEAGSERVDSVMRGDEEGVSTSRFSGVSPDFRSKYTQEE